MKSKKRSFISASLLPLAALLATGAGTIPAPTPKTSTAPQTVQQQNQREKQTPAQQSLKIQNQYTDDAARLPFVTKRKYKRGPQGNMSRHKQKMSNKPYFKRK